MSFSGCINFCLDKCTKRKRVGRDVLCDFSGRSITVHALAGVCADPAGDRYPASAKEDREASGAAAAQNNQCGCAGGGLLLKQSLRRLELLSAICKGCEHFAGMTIRERPLLGAVSCRATPGCCGAEAGTVDLLAGACIELKHEKALAELEKEFAGCDGESCGGEG